MTVRPPFAILAGALLTAIVALLFARATASSLTERLNDAASAVIAKSSGKSVTASFTSPSGFFSRHPELSGGEKLDESTRAAVAKAVAATPGIGGVRWSDGTVIAESGEIPLTPAHCQDDVQALLRARTIRFEESSSNMDQASRQLLDEVATALRPCLGSIIAITGHTDSSGPEPGNIALSQERASSVRQALINRGIPRDGLRVRGLGSKNPVAGLDPTDPANRRIEFSVIATVPLAPTPVDTPSAR